MITEQQIYIKKVKIPWRTIEEEAVIVDLQNNCVMQLNDVARHIWENIDGNARVAAIVDSIVAVYEVDRDTARNEALRFIDSLVEKRLIHDVSTAALHSGSAV